MPKPYVRSARDNVYMLADIRARRARASAQALIAPVVPSVLTDTASAERLSEELAAGFANLPAGERHILRLKIALVIADLLEMTETLARQKKEVVDRLQNLRRLSSAANAYTQTGNLKGQARR